MFKKIIVLLLPFVLVSCTKAPLYRDKFIVAGTYLEVISHDRRASQIVHEEIKRLSALFNFYDEKSELGRLNNTCNVPFKVSKEMIELLNLSFQVTQMSEGSFDVTHGALYDFWKNFIRKGKIEQLPSQEEIEKVRNLGGMENVVIDKTQDTVTITRQGLKIDLGAIAKGYMVDQAQMRLKEKGVNSALVNLGGHIYCLGINNDQPWSVGIQDPRELSGVIESQKIIDEAIATSGDYQQFFECQGKRYSHLIDPRTGYPIDNNVASVSVITKNCTTADGLATAFSVLGVEGIENFLKKIPSTMRIFVVTQDEQGKHLRIFQ